MTQARYKSQFPVRAVRAKTNEVADYHKDDAKPGKPLYLLVPGGLIALASLALIIWSVYAAYVDGSLASEQATTFLCLLAPVYIGGVFLFSYGYELYDIPRALRLTAIIVFLTVAAVLIVAVFAALLGGGKSSSSSKSSSSGSSSKSSSSSSGGGIGNVVGSLFDGVGSSGGSSYRAGSGAPIFLNLGGLGSPGQTVTHEVIREVPVPTEPPPPQPVACPFCGRSYIPAENKFACPQCGAATPKELLPPDADDATSNSNPAT